MISWDTWALAIDLRAVVRLVVLSAALVLAAQLLFQRNAPSRRQFLLWAAPPLLVLPWVVGWLNLAIPVGVFEPPQWSLERLVPAGLVWSVLAISVTGVIRTAMLAWYQRRNLLLLPRLDDVRLQQIAAPLLVPLGLAQMPCFRGYQANLGLPQAPFASSKAGGQVVLPAHYQQLDDNRLRAIITHEFVHLARHDDWGRLLMRTLISLYWFLPWLRTLERDFLEAMEHSCDDRAADFFGPSLSYMEGVVGAVGAVGAVSASVPNTHRTPVGSKPENSINPLSCPMHPLLLRVMRFGQRREFDADSMRVAGYLLLTLAAGLIVASVQPVPKAPATGGLIATAGLALPDPAPDLAPDLAPELQQSLARIPSVKVMLAQPLASNQSTATTQLRARDQPLPVYPGAALRAQLEGEVWVDYQIAMDGSVVNPQVVHSAPAGHFESSALTTVRRTRYQHLSQYRLAPLSFARAGPTSVGLRVRQRFRYQLQPSY